MQDREINILGTTYTIRYKNKEEDETLNENNGYCDESIKTIVIENMIKEKYSCEDLERIQRKVLRHEIIHAYLFESGLNECLPNQSGQSELWVDWYARQFPKIYITYQELNILN